jgi:hypothetical protein
MFRPAGGNFHSPDEWVSIAETAHTARIAEGQPGIPGMSERGHRHQQHPATARWPTCLACARVSMVDQADLGSGNLFRVNQNTKPALLSGLRDDPSGVHGSL